MSPQIHILDTLITRLNTIDKPSVGYLYGIKEEEKIWLVGFNFEAKLENENFRFSPTDCLYISEASLPFSESPQIIYPGGIVLCGILNVGNRWQSDENNTQSVPSHIKTLFKGLQDTCTPLVYLKKSLDNGSLEAYYIKDVPETKDVQSSFDILSYSEFSDRFIYFQIMSTLTSNLKIKPQSDNAGVFETLVDTITSGLLYKINESDFYWNCASESSVGSIYDQYPKAKDHKSNFEVLRIIAYPPSGNSKPLQEKCPAPSILEIYSKQKFKKDEPIEKSISIPFDGLFIVPRNVSVNDFISVLTAAARRILFLNQNLVERNSNDLELLRTYSWNHFFLDELGHPITLLVSSEDLHVDVRKELHSKFNLALDRPRFKKANRLRLTSSQPCALVNIHLGVNQISRSNNIRQALVYGKYAYYHYMVDNFNDQGWGCAYRSLQTVCSWFKFQGYVERDIPTHQEIQKTLVEIGDKEPSFVGSRQWIGSTEVGFFLESKWDVSSRIQHVSSGAEMDTLAELLLEHFVVHGTPIMIGGGVLAHTIIGIQIDEVSGETHFLILDPHYTAPKTDLQTVLKKGFVGWKRVNFWDQKSFYNLLLPQRKICI